MLKRIIMVAVVVAFIAALRPAYQIGVAAGWWQPLGRPVGVSARAHYVETMKSAAWFDCSVDQVRDVNVCRAWDRDGTLIAFGNYRLDGENRSATQSELRPWRVHDGNPQHPTLAWIYLFGVDTKGMPRTLVPVNNAGQPLERFEVRVGDHRP